MRPRNHQIDFVLTNQLLNDLPDVAFLEQHLMRHFAELSRNENVRDALLGGLTQLFVGDFGIAGLGIGERVRRDDVSEKDFGIVTARQSNGIIQSPVRILGKIGEGEDVAELDFLLGVRFRRLRGENDLFDSCHDVLHCLQTVLSRYEPFCMYTREMCIRRAVPRRCFLLEKEEDRG